MKAHQLRPNASTNSPRIHVFLDTESQPLTTTTGAAWETQVLRLWCASAVRLSAGKVVRRWTGQGTTQASFWSWLRERCYSHSRVWVWGHNIQVDVNWLGAWEMIDRGELVYKSSVLSHPPFLLKVELHGRAVQFVDTLNWFRGSLASLGEAASLSKPELPAQDDDESKWFERCRADVAIVEKIVLELIAWVKREDLGQLRATAPGQSWHSWRHIFQGPFPVVHDVPELSAHERSGYFGGECQLRFRGHVREEKPQELDRLHYERQNGPTLWGRRIHVLDARGFYPFVMRNHLFPWRYQYTRSGLPVEVAAQIAGRKGVIACCRIESNSDTYPVRLKGETTYARGDFWTTLCGPELLWAHGKGQLKTVGRVAVYDLADLFSVWVERIWGLRERFEREGNRLWEMLAKVLLNSLYGKFGQTSREWKEVKDKEARRRWGEWLECGWERGDTRQFRGIAGNTQERMPDGEWEHACVSIAAYVTSYGRVLAREWMELIPEGELLYHDTDSLHVTDKGLAALEASGLLSRLGLGALRKLGTYCEAEYRSPKFYALDGDVRAAGIPSRARKIGHFSWEYDLWETLDEMIDRGPDGTQRIRKVKVNALEARIRGTVGPDGWISPPVLQAPEPPF